MADDKEIFVEEKKSFFGKVWQATKNVYEFLDHKKVTIGWAMVAISNIVPDPTVKVILQVAGALIGGEGVVDNYRKGRYAKENLSNWKNIK
jgi:hypothetical protein